MVWWGTPAWVVEKRMADNRPASNSPVLTTPEQAPPALAPLPPYMDPSRPAGPVPARRGEPETGRP